MQQVQQPRALLFFLLRALSVDFRIFAHSTALSSTFCGSLLGGEAGPAAATSGGADAAAAAAAADAAATLAGARSASVTLGKSKLLFLQHSSQHCLVE